MSEECSPEELQKDFRNIPLTIIPLTPFPAFSILDLAAVCRTVLLRFRHHVLSCRFPSLSVAYCRFRSVYGWGGGCAMKRGRQNLPGWDLAKGGTQAGIIWHYLNLGASYCQIKSDKIR
jgi:hypothetical protein